MQQKLKAALISCIVMVIGCAFVCAGVANAALPNPGGSTTSPSTSSPATSATPPPYTPDPATTGANPKTGGNCTSLQSCDLIVKYIDPLVNLLAALVGVVIVISIVLGGIQYGSSGGDPQKTSAAKARIRNAIIALAAFMLLYTGLAFLLPGGFGG